MKIYVAVTKEFKEWEENLRWLLEEKMLRCLQQDSDEKLKIVITHVLVPSAKTPAGNRQRDRENTERCLDRYLFLCSEKKVQAEKLVYEADDIAKGLVQLTALHRIATLVMGAAANRNYSRGMDVPTSMTAWNVNLHADQYCDIWFVCKGNLIYRRYAFSVKRETGSVADTSSETTENGSDSEVTDKPRDTLLEAEKKAYYGFQSYSNVGRNEDEAIRTAKAYDVRIDKEVKRRKDIEETLSRERLEAEALKTKHDEINKKLQVERENNLAWEIRGVDYDNIITGLKQRLEAITMAHKEVKLKYDAVVKEIEKLNRKKDLASTSGIQRLENFSEFSSSEIERAIKNFGDVFKIGEGGFGSVYKGLLRNTVVAIKRLKNPQSTHGKDEFSQEVAVLGRVRHPNIVTLIGACSEACTLIYEYLPNGNLAERLKCKNNTPPLTWRARTRIAFEICSALIFLHSNKPHPIVHGDLKPENILLDANLISKLGDFGLCRLLRQSSASGSTFFHMSDNVYGTRPYIDPEYFRTGELTKFCDIYSFGIVILQLITGKGPVGIIDIVNKAVEKREFHILIDREAGPWPYVQAKKLVNLGLKCCETSRRNRPDLVEKLWTALQSMLPTSSELAMDDGVHVPDYFFCPITMDIMEDPHMAADGFTYEGKAIENWFNSGQNRSPVTNKTLPDRVLIKNLALCADIKEWLQKHKRS